MLMSAITRPQSLIEVADGCRSLSDLSMRLADFLHEFALHPDLATVSERPELLSGSMESGDVADAYLAATAQALATRLGKPRPEWTTAPERYLHHPWFARTGYSMRACLLLES